MNKNIRIFGAREHNLQNIDVNIPRNALTVVTGVSGSGKSSLIFDTLFAEGQRRYLETFSSFARFFIGQLNRPDMDKIEGLSPVIAIEQKTVNRNPRSSVGTITEIYDLLRVLFANASTAYSPVSNKPMISYSGQQIVDLVGKNYLNKKILVFAPLIRARKGNYNDLFQLYFKKGFTEVRINGETKALTPLLSLNRFKTHDIELVIDEFTLKNLDDKRLENAIITGLKLGKGTIMIDSDDQLRYYSQELVCEESGMSYPTPHPNTFSFNSPKGACETCGGLGLQSVIDVKSIIPNDGLSILSGAIVPLVNNKKDFINRELKQIAKKYKFKLTDSFKKIPEEAKTAILYGEISSNKINNKKIGVTEILKISFEGVIPILESEPNTDKKYSSFYPCKTCEGKRLKSESLYFKVLEKDIHQVNQMSILNFQNWIKKLQSTKFSNIKKKVVDEIYLELQKKTDALLDLGLGYLSLSRRAYTLSGGESQRIRLASQISTQIVDATYILDEPSIGLHQKDNAKLILSLQKLRDMDNTVIVVEHDMEIMKIADYLIDIGPLAGKMGGELMFSDIPKNIAQNESGSITLDYITGKKEIEIPEKRKTSNEFLEIKGCLGNNLKNIDLKLPLGIMIAVTGVSGSGKSTLINQTLYPILRNAYFRTKDTILPYKSVKGIDLLDKVIKVDQLPIGRSPRSNPATYTDVFTHIRNIFAQTIGSKVNGFTSSNFSYNVKVGRCPVCQGRGKKTIEMNFIPDVYVDCEQCKGDRFIKGVLDVKYKGKSIADVLNMTIIDAADFFKNIPKIYQKLKTLIDVGLGYITLGQPSNTLSGGEAQRIKLAYELSKKDTGKTMFILDEPTTGLHHEDIKILLKSLQVLVDKGNTVLIIEHNMDVMKYCDYLIDIGPEAGEFGGEIIGYGTPEAFVKKHKTHTSVYLEKELK